MKKLERISIVAEFQVVDSERGFRDASTVSGADSVPDGRCCQGKFIGVLQIAQLIVHECDVVADHVGAALVAQASEFVHALLEVVQRDQDVVVFPGDADVVEGLRGAQAISQLLIKLQAAFGILSVLKIVPGCDVVSAQGCE